MRRIGMALLCLPALAVAALAEPGQPDASAEVLALPQGEAGVSTNDGILHTACHRKAPLPLFRRLIAQGFDANSVDGIGQSPLHACARTCAECIAVLAAGGAKLDQGDQLGRTPLEIALDVGKLDTAEALLRAGATPNIENRDGNSPYMLALYGTPRPGMAELMARYGGRLTLRQRVRHFLRQAEPSNLIPQR